MKTITGLTIIFLCGVLFGLASISKIASALSFIIKFQLKIFMRQCRVFYVLRKRYKNK